jgi:hypothetical protein
MGVVDILDPEQWLSVVCFCPLLAKQGRIRIANMQQSGRTWGQIWCARCMQVQVTVFGFEVGGRKRACPS